MEYVIFIDIAVVVLLFVLAVFSKRLGEALKKPPYYKLMYVSIALIILSSELIVFPVEKFLLGGQHSTVIPLTIKAVSSVIALVATLQYWKWLFLEFIHRK